VLKFMEKAHLGDKERYWEVGYLMFIAYIGSD
jgi:hypothetical protein